MAFELSGNVEILRIVELLTKVLSPSDLSDYYVAIDKDGTPATENVSLSALLALGGGSFNDAVFEVFNSVDNTKKLNLSLASLTTATTVTLSIPDVSGLVAVAGMTDAFSFGGQAHGGSNVIAFSASITFNGNNGNNQLTTFTGDSTLAASNLLPGIYEYKGIISGVGVTSITIGATFGTAYPNNDAIPYTDGSTFIITLIVDPSNNKQYTITSWEA